MTESKNNIDNSKIEEVIRLCITEQTKYTKGNVKQILKCCIFARNHLEDTKEVEEYWEVINIIRHSK